MLAYDMNTKAHGNGQDSSSARHAELDFLTPIMLSCNQRKQGIPYEQKGTCTMGHVIDYMVFDRKTPRKKMLEAVESWASTARTATSGTSTCMTAP